MTDPTTADVVASLLAEDEAVALAAGGDAWRREYGGRIEDDAARLIVQAAGGAPAPEQADHITRQHPARTLHRVAALRALIDDITAEQHLVVGDPWYTCLAATEEVEGDRTAREDESTECDCGRDERVERRLRLLAAAWPEYRKEQP